MTESEQPQQPEQPSPWARGGAVPDHDNPGGTGAVQGGAVTPESTGARGAWQGGPARPEDEADGSAAGVDRSDAGSVGASQGSAPRPVPSDVTGASQDSALRPDSVSGAGVVGAVQGGAGLPGTGQPAPGQPGFGQPGPGVPGFGQTAWQGGYSRPEHDPRPSGPYYAPPGQVVPPPPRGRNKIVAGVAALVLAVGGVAGGVGGYVGYQAAERSGPVTNALNEAPPAQETGNAPDGSIEQVAQKVLPTVVQVQVTGGAGSGFTISSDGLVLTNNHVVESAADGGPIRVQLQDGRSFDAKIVGRDPTSDLAVLKAEDVSDLPTAELGNSGDLKIGEQVVAVGSPFDLSGTVTSGIVSSLNRPVRAGGQQGTPDTVLNAIQTDAAINPGNSGGPLVNMRGQVVGINSAIYSPNSSQSAQGGSVGIGFAIPIDQARRTAKELAETGKANQTVLGVQVNDAPNGGALVREVTAGGAAEAAGVKPGDVITKFGDRRVDSSDALVAAVRSRAPGEKVQVTIGESRTVEVTLGSQPVELR